MYEVNGIQISFIPQARMYVFHADANATFWWSGFESGCLRNYPFKKNE